MPLTQVLTTLFGVTIALSGFAPSIAQEAIPDVMDNRSGDTIPFDSLLDNLKRADVVFLGEKHDNDAGHTFQLKVIEALQREGCELAIGMEQFERDVQGAVDDYLAGRLPEDEFLKVARPWKNYSEHYRPIVEFAKANNIPIVAGNLPRKLATKISEGRDLEAHELPYAARTSSFPADRYWANFLKTMQGHMGADGEEKLKWFYAAQCAKDDAMAEAITDYLATNQHRKRIVVQLCGHFHSDFGLGTVARVQSRRPLLHCVVLTMELPATAEQADKSIEVERDRAHYTVWTVPNPTK